MKRRFNPVTARPAPGTQAVLRAAAVLKAFTEDHPAWGISELAHAVGLHKTTVFRLLGALEREGLVARDLHGSYRIGPDLIAVGLQALRGNSLRECARPELEALAAETQETAMLDILIGDEVLVLDEVQGRRVIGAGHEVGTRWPAHATSTGKVLLAARGDLPRGRLARATPRTIASAAALARELARVRERGYGTTVDELETGFTAIGAPVRNVENEVVAALSINGPSARLTAARLPALALLVRAAADRISRRLGADLPPAAARRARRRVASS